MGLNRLAKAALLLPFFAAAAYEGVMAMSDISALNGNWIVVEAGEIDPRDGLLRLEISDGEVFGRAPCKYFTSNVLVSEDSFLFGPLNMRGDTCDQDIMADEQAYFRVLERLSHYRIEADGTLVLISYGIDKIRARLEE